MDIENIKNTILKEKKEVGEQYSEITFAINKIIDFSDETDIKGRYFIRNIEILNKYIKMIENLEMKLDKKKKILFFNISDFNKNEIKTLLEEIKEYKKKYIDVFEKLKYCYKCECIRCIKNCKFKSCLSCGKNGLVTECDKTDYNIIMFNNCTSNLYNNETNCYDKVNVLAQVDIYNEKTSFRVIEVKGEFLILTYTYDMSKGDVYGEVINKEVFNFVADIYERNVSNTI